MKVVVIGGHTRNIGKTSVMAGLLRDLTSLSWTAVKITQYGHGICSRDGRPCECAPTEHPFALTEERDPYATADTSRYLAAGAVRSLWLRVRQGQLAEAFPVLSAALGRDDWVMIESNSILDLLKPSLYLMVLDSSQRDFKPSARRFLDQADALVSIRRRPEQAGRSGLDIGSVRGKPVFSVGAPTYFSPELCCFVRQKIAAAQPGPQHALL